VRVAVVDYGIGNLHSVARALESCGAEVLVSDSASVLDSASRLVLPGVGAFADGMQGLRDRSLVEPIRRFAASGRPLLGICLGMQMLAGSSEEFGLHEGLGIVPGHVVPVPSDDVGGAPHKIPHIGWADLLPWRTGGWHDTLLADTRPGTAVYLVHSYHFMPERESDGLAVCMYGGHRITAAVQRGSVIGCQFHPEKSGPEGLRVLSAFLEL
jgi:glutamine amidotransferase